MGDERLSIRAQVLLWTAQRASAAVLAVCVIVHLLTLIYAVRNGLTAAEILGRTRGSIGWSAFYGLFVVAVAVHAPIGLRSFLSETFDWRGRGLDLNLRQQGPVPSRALYLNVATVDLPFPICGAIVSLRRRSYRTTAADPPAA